MSRMPLEIRFPATAAVIAVPWHLLVGDPVQYLPYRVLFVGAFSLGCLWLLRRFGWITD